MTFSVVDHFFLEKKTPDFFRTKLVWVRVESGLGLVVVFWAFFEIPLLITLEPHVSHTKFPDVYALSWIVIRWCGNGVSSHLCQAISQALWRATGTIEGPQLLYLEVSKTEISKHLTF